MKSKYWIVGWLSIVVLGLALISIWVYKIDPYMHFHKPNTLRYYYSLDNQRSQNDGITKHFDYDALITGTSMTENFKTSEMDKLFGCSSIKVSYSGGSYKELNDNLKIAANSNPNLKTIVRGLDMSMFFDNKDRMREDLGKYPTYLYDYNILNDLQYIWNREIVWNRAYAMTEANNQKKFTPGITSFDDYSSWQYSYTFGVNTVCPDGIDELQEVLPLHLTVEEKETIQGNIEQNVTRLADENPDITFYYFITPYSIVWWQELVANGSIYRQIEAEEYIIELITEHENIRLFSFNNRYDIITDLNHYKDDIHYAQWINSLMLCLMKEGECLLTKDNYKDYINKELEFYTSYDYMSINEQIDYEDDFYAAAILNEELAGVVPIDILNSRNSRIELNNATIKKSMFDTTIESYITNKKYIGARIELWNIEGYGYLAFCGKKIADQGQPMVYVYNKDGIKLGEIALSYDEIDDEWHQYVIDISKHTGEIIIYFNDGNVDSTEDTESKYVFTDIKLY